jgi:lipopolysaccharide/colanic/teichoic acid biosynthesis glycosyltransferase
MKGLKRVLDVLAASVALLVCLVPLAGLMLWVRLDSQGSALFAQTRIGQDGRPFKMWKLRTMHAGAERQWTPPAASDALSYRFQERQDLRVTAPGRFLRRTSLDELPQLWNVMTGAMSLVGPRPEIPEMVALYPDYAHARHMVRPGITGLAQVMGRGELTLEESLTWDLWYCEHWSMALDIKILIKTVFSVFSRRGAY